MALPSRLAINYNGTHCDKLHLFLFDTFFPLLCWLVCSLAHFYCLSFRHQQNEIKCAQHCLILPSSRCASMWYIHLRFGSARMWITRVRKIRQAPIRWHLNALVLLTKFCFSSFVFSFAYFRSRTRARQNCFDKRKFPSFQWSFPFSFPMSCDLHFNQRQHFRYDFSIYYQIPVSPPLTRCRYFSAKNKHRDTHFEM